MQSGKMSPFLKIMLFLGLAFLYIPLVVLVVQFVQTGYRVGRFFHPMVRQAAS